MSVTEAAFGVALDPFLPKQILPPPGLAAAPPTCPLCGTFLHPVDQNPAGDVFFECLNGDLASAGHYSAVYRVATKAWDQHPAFRRDDWVAPGTEKKPVTAPSAPTAKTFVQRMAEAKAKKRRKKK